MRFRVGVAFRATAPLAYAVLVPLATITGPSALFIAGFCDSIFRVPDGAMLVYEPMAPRPGECQCDFLPYQAGRAMLGDVDVRDAQRLYVQRYLDLITIDALESHWGED